MKKSLEATFINAKKGTYLDEKDHLDACCRSFHKCNAFKHIEFNHTNNWSHCDCIHFFQKCLKNSDTSLSNELAFIHSINATKCYAKDYPITKCIKFESYPEWKAPFLRFVNSAEREKFFNRCSKYELDERQPQRIQLFDLPYNYHGMSVNDTGKLSTKSVNLFNIFVFVQSAIGGSAAFCVNSPL